MNSCRTIWNYSPSSLLTTRQLNQAIPSCRSSNYHSVPLPSYPLLSTTSPRPFPSPSSLPLLPRSLTPSRFSSSSASHRESSSSPPPRPKSTQSIFSKLLGGSATKSPSSQLTGQEAEDQRNRDRNMEMAKALERTLRGRGMAGLSSGNMDVRCTTLDKTYDLFSRFQMEQ